MVGGGNKGMSASDLNSDHDHDPPHSILTRASLATTENHSVKTPVVAQISLSV